VKNVAKDFPIICVGGSAGGLDTYIRLLKNLPSDMGVAIVIVNHLRTVATLLHEILPKYTQMQVRLIEEKLDIIPNQVFIIPEKRDLHVLNEEFRLKPISKPFGWPDVITVFMRSLTKNWEGKLATTFSRRFIHVLLPLSHDGPSETGRTRRDRRLRLSG
jgi:chemotaxis response regulator CheB